MKTTKFPRHFLSVFFLFCAFAVNIQAQCEDIYFKTTKRSLFPNAQFAVFNSPYSPILSRLKDITGDGKIDLIGGTRVFSGVYIASGDGNGNFGSPSLFQFPDGGTFFVEDFTGDGLNDLLVEFQNSVSQVRYVIYKNDGGATSFTPLAPTVIDNFFETVVNVVDINNDNRPDISLGNSYRLGNADGTFGAPITPSGGIYFKFAADFSADGFKDFVYPSGGDSLRIAYGDANGNFSTGSFLPIGNNPAVVTITDLNNDALPDILAQSNGQFVVRLLQSNGSFSFAAYPISSPSVNFFAEDFTGDGFKDLLVKPAGSDSSLLNPTKPATLYVNNGSGAFTPRSIEVPQRSFSIGDFDGDNKADLFVINNNFTSVGSTSEMLFGDSQIHFQKNVCQKSGRTKIFDFDGDNLADKAFFRPGDGSWLIKRSRDGFINFNWGLSGDVPAPGDFDGDGRTDAAIFRPSNGTWYIVKSSDGSFLILQFGISGDKPVASDYDGDGKSDIGVFRPSDGNWYIYHTGTGQVSIAHFGISEDKPVQEDYDGDGKTDFAVFRPSTGIWYYLKSSDGNFGAVNWGIATDKPLPADYDGDGKADFAVFRASDNKWYVLRSYNQQYIAYGFGVTGDVPQPTDWDGSGTFDLGIYRQSTTLWYSTLSLNPDNFGGAADMFPITPLVQPE